MLQEFKDVRQIPNEGWRRWFADRDMDLIVWYNGENSESSVLGFQICYDKQKNEHALTWSSDRGFSHNRIDDGENVFSSKMTPVLVADGLPPLQRILSLFENASSEVDTDLREFVLERLRNSML